jgi:S1-C subfamily serine protease
VKPTLRQSHFFCMWFGLFAAGLLGTARAGSDAIDLVALAKQARPAVLLLTVMDESGRPVASGTGFLVSSDGKFVTNRHVANAGPRSFAKAANGRQYPVLGVLAEDSDKDLVLLKIDGHDLPALPVGASDGVTAGLPVAIIGNPLGLDGTATEGTVSGVRELLGERRWIEVTAAFARGSGDLNPTIVHGDSMQVTTPLAHGSSGSPVLNPQGELIGVVTAVTTKEGRVVSMVIPSSAIKGLLAQASRSSGPQPLAGLSARGANDLVADRDFRAASLAYKAGDYAEAERQLKTVVARFPNSPVAHLLLGQTYAERRSYVDAASSFECAIQLRHDLTPAWYGLVAAYAQQGLHDKARDALRELQQLDSNLANELTRSFPSLGR